MEQKEYGGKMLEIDEDGFIQDPDLWDKAVAAVPLLGRAGMHRQRGDLGLLGGEATENFTVIGVDVHGIHS